MVLLFAMGCGTEQEMVESSTNASDGTSSSGTGSTDSMASTDSMGSTGLPTDSDDTSHDDASDDGMLPCAPAGGAVVEQDVMLQAEDGTGLAAMVARPAEGACLPGLLLVHQFSMDRHQWDSMLPTLVGEGYVVLAVDLRGHGDSDPQQGALTDLLTDPNQAPQDVAAGLAWLAADAGVDADRLGVVGTSIGANLSVVALHQGLVVAAVPVSPRLDPILSLAGSPAALSLGRPLLCLATDGDGGGDQAASCDALVAQAPEGSALQIIEGSSAHGVALLEQFPEVEPTIVAFLNATI